jgi:hypothetical protein
MSFDIIFLRPVDSSGNDLDMPDEVHPMGSNEVVSFAFEQIFPGALAGIFICGERYAVEVELAGDPVQSAHLVLRFGSSWSNQIHDEFIATLTKLCEILGTVAFAVSDNSRLAPVPIRA